jgi:hypothetical protein
MTYVFLDTVVRVHVANLLGLLCKRPVTVRKIALELLRWTIRGLRLQVLLLMLLLLLFSPSRQLG